MKEKKPGPTLDAKTAARVIDADLVNIVKKAKAGKPLTPSERAIVLSHTGPEPETPDRKSTSYDSIGAAAAALGISVDVLKKAKRAGAPGFKGSRVYPELLVPWLRARDAAAKGKPPAEDKDSLEKRLLLGKCEQVERENQEKRGELLLSSEVEAWLSERVERVNTILRQALLHELPPALVGLGAVQIATRMEKVLGEVTRALRGGK